MAKKGKSNFVKMKSSETGHEYYTTKNKQKHPERMELTKYDPLARKHVAYKEAK
ncbi:MAG: 50S ribosomal protein L33 [Vampirovibrionales bacterium]|nr:50S ribosomal protein L33 [Vampirovibrionales bacterium]